MDSPEVLKSTIQSIATMKCLRFGGIALTLYDYLLMFDDEIRYVWRGRKTPIFYFYILTRAILIAVRLWEIYVLFRPRDSRAGCAAGFHAQVVLAGFLLFASDIFVTLRVYALTLRNKFVVVYFGILAATRYATGLSSSLGNPIGLFDLPKIPIPLDTFDACLVVPHLRFKPVPDALGTALDLSAFLVVAWCTLRNTSALKVSALIRTIASEATIYFFAMVALQVYSQLSLVFMEGVPQAFSLVANSIINPVLSLRFAVSLKKAANPDGGQDWRLKHFSSVEFAGGPLSGTQAPTVCESIEMDPVDPQNDRLETYGP